MIACGTIPLFQTVCEDNRDFSILKFHAGPPYEVRIIRKSFLMLIKFYLGYRI